MMCLRGLQGLNSSGEVVDFDKTWDVIESSLREIHTRNASNLLFEELYRNAYRLVLKKKGEALYNKVKGFEEAWLKEQVRSKLRASLSGSLSSGASAALGPTGTERRVAGERFLRGLKQAWEDHILCMNMTTDVLMYMVGLSSSSKMRISLPMICLHRTTDVTLYQASELRARCYVLVQIHPPLSEGHYFLNANFCLGSRLLC